MAGCRQVKLAAQLDSWTAQEFIQPPTNHPHLPFARLSPSLDQRPHNPTPSPRSNFANILVRSWKLGEKIGRKSVFHIDF